jgi:hypothetical protein
MTRAIAKALNGLQVFTALRDTYRVERNAVDEAGERRREAHDERNDTAPVGGVPRRVAVHAVKVVHVGDGHVAATRDVVTAGISSVSCVMSQDGLCLLGHQNCCHRSQEDSIATEESKKLLS